MARFIKGRDLDKWASPRPPVEPHKLRIIGGKYRGRQLQNTGDRNTRPMKDNVREAVFNLIGGKLQGKVVFDLFAGTGAIALEAISRGAERAVLIERNFATARTVQENIQTLDVASQTELVTSDTFFWSRQFLSDPQNWPQLPWAVFCSPPYALFIERTDEMIQLVGGLIQAAPRHSLFVIESDARLARGRLPDSRAWTTRQYSPALINLYTKT